MGAKLLDILERCVAMMLFEQLHPVGYQLSRCNHLLDPRNRGEKICQSLLASCIVRKVLRAHKVGVNFRQTLFGSELGAS